MQPNDTPLSQETGDSDMAGNQKQPAGEKSPVDVKETDNVGESVAEGPVLETTRVPSSTTPETASPESPPPAGAVSSVVAESRLGGWTWLLHFGLKSAILVAVGAILLTMVGVAQRTGWITEGGFLGSNGSSQSGASEGQDEGKRYICPMMCTPPSTEPGRCPVCGMELVESTASNNGDGISVTIEASARRLVGIQTAQSKLGDMTRTIRTIGSIDFDESRLSTISAYTDGRLEKMYADYVGVKVSEGDDLALLYSPQLYTAQTEYVTSLESHASSRFNIGNGDMTAMARENLSELGMTQEQITLLNESRLPQSRIRIKSPQSGTVIEKSAVEGDYVKTGQKLMRIADLSSVWLMLDLFPDDAINVRFGQQVEAEIQSMPGEVFTGRVAFIDPTVSKRTRTIGVRVEVLNFDGKLRPGDYATAKITVPAIPGKLVYDPALSGKYISPMHPQVIRDGPGSCPLCGMDLISTQQLGYATEPQPQQRVVTVPRDAVLLTGDIGVIYVETEPGRFEIRRVHVGPMNETEAVIVEGLAAGETVATGGNFLIDSQMQLAGNPSLLDPSRAPSYAPGPLELHASHPLILTEKAGQEFDRAFDAYFEIQAALATDLAPPPVALNTLLDALSALELSAQVPDEVQKEIAKARRSAVRMAGTLESARVAFRSVSHALLRAAVDARGPKSALSLTHYYCPMVPGGGGDWMQPGGEIANPYWGSAMQDCGELVRQMGSVEGAAPHEHPEVELWTEDVNEGDLSGGLLQ
ncbi:efflux RND transporter periplasmic adaptor subunit [Aureliella helgolandensis]|uniref:Cation efflux system protein CusB n=1 Tax=Aureliella helgolandensis TaxID=2527968 RepID=A0A518G423_9BACT|nr:efflux RND transporter periplasmic adaptor subunit [Aureliella helgolandensis]QDV23348.1 Cation efflux system protein CusB precursor [Aureliella helgolandensis]